MGASGKGTIAVATSIPPALIRQDAGRAAPDYQALCIQSWIGNGFRVISVNHVDEIPALAQRYPEVTFVPTARDAREWTGRKNPYIADLLLALADAKEPVLGIINSDLLFEPSAAWAQKLPATVTQSLVVAHRYDAKSLRNGALRRYFGVDCFFFDKTVASLALEGAMPFAMGVPWWDYWLPCMALLDNRTIVAVDRPAILHLAHETAYRHETWRAFARIFSQSVIDRLESLPCAPTDAMAPLLPYLREIVAAVQEGGKLDHAYRPFVGQFVRLVRRNAVAWSPDGDPAAPDTPSTIAKGMFEDFDRRIAAGEALRQARILAANRNWSAIGPDMVAALNLAPEDPEILDILGRISVVNTAPRMLGPARRALARVKSLFMTRGYSGPPH
jgi:hypothetical protein